MMGRHVGRCCVPCATILQAEKDGAQNLLVAIVKAVETVCAEEECIDQTEHPIDVAVNDVVSKIRRAMRDIVGVEPIRIESNG